MSEGSERKPGPSPRSLDFGSGVDGSHVAWDAAREAAEDAGVSLKPIHGIEGAERVGVVVEALWGPGQLPPSLIRAFDYAGTVILGAFADGDLVGIVLGFPGLDEGLHMHSHMLGVLRDRQSRGVGYALKLGQRAACLDLGIDEVRWTYDPLVARNGWFNLVKLGVVGTRLHRGFYGRMDDEINRGDRSDRFEVRWRLASERVLQALRGETSEPALGPLLLDLSGEPDAPRPEQTGAEPKPGAVIRVPLDYHEVRRRDPGLGEAWRETSARAFEACFDAGLVASWISRDGRYVFEPAGEGSK
jgi:predicted GNAT superfamily acetyltransferase